MTLDHARFIEAWNECSDNVLLGFWCGRCHQQFDVVRDAERFAIGMLCACPTVSRPPDVNLAELN